MRYIKTYDNVLYDPNVEKLSKAFADFFNSIHPELKCYTTNSYSVMNYEKQLLSISDTGYRQIRIVFVYDINYYFSRSDVENLLNFIQFEGGQYISKENIDKFIDKLTKENYELFLISNHANKYNI
jgi:hypothetical protein